MRLTLLIAATRPLHLLVLAVACAAGLTIAWWLLPLGLATYALLTLLALRDPAVQQAAQQRRARPPQRPRGTPFEPQLQQIAAVQTRISQSVAATTGPLRTTLERVVAQVDELVPEAYALADKGQTISSYLHQLDRPRLDAQLVRLEQQIKTAADPMLRQQYTETHASVAEQIKNAEALAIYFERIRAQLDNICANLDNVLAETVRLRAAPAVDATPSASGVSQRLADLRADMDALGHMLDSALTGVV